MKRPVVLAMVGWPDDEAAGPVHSLIALYESVSDEFEFKIIARQNRFGQKGGETREPGWTQSGSARVHWCRMSRFGPEGLRDLLNKTPHDMLMLNSIFDRELTLPTLVLRRLGLIPGRPTLLSPRGEFARGSLTLKSARKRSYLALARATGLLSDVWLHATNEDELADINRGYPWARSIVAPNVRLLFDLPPYDAGAQADPCVTRIAFVGRISRVKNLHYALTVLCHVRCRVEFDIFGPVSDPAYWWECETIVASLPKNVTVSLKGPIPNNSVPAVLAPYDLFFLPTLGENFGHAIFEAFASGVPVLISDRTPWQQLETNEAGWSLPLSEPQSFVQAIETLARMPPPERQRLRRGARRAVEEMVARSNAVARNRAMFRTLIASGRGREVGR